ncbi:serine protease 7-like [Coccinella septempunctata]|uniref:serine protease 7-like n=1 Tax=Coccinella septempunctata TaxID=41139 RepID=UPI001D084C5E|nr:serine protease 7-like [Coccinella septempunctata]
MCLWKIAIFLSVFSGWASPSLQGHDEQRGLFGFLFSPCQCKCGIKNLEARFLGGEYTKGHEFPWLALIQIKGFPAASATLINSRYVITAAWHLIGLTPYDIKITFGQFDKCFPDVSSNNVSVEKILIHPDFNPSNRAHDIALVKTTGTIIFERRISPICLGFPDTKYVGQVATVAGWDQSKNSDGSSSSSCRPKKVGLPVLGPSECLMSRNVQNVSADKGCLGVLGAPSVICGSDAGSPVMYRSYDGVYELIGIMTDSNECSTQPSTALYTRIDEHLSWITRSTREGCYCLKI